ncbi:MAG: RnfABCDGE type electron transport complex subunit D, partial [Lentisphaerae bacterium]|nr:RnfABCDGE type electron transport complex subunit D [Lentisphaerota bacterium]
VGSAFGVLVGKELFGGTGRNLFNPAMVGRCFLALSYPAAMSSGWIRPGCDPAGRLTQYVDASCVDALSSATPLGAAKHGELAPWLDVVAGAVPGCAGETSAVAVTLGGAFLLLVGISNWRTVVATLGSFAALNTVLHLSLPGSFGPTLWQLVAGGFLFGAFFMATDPVTAPTTNLGKWVYGTLIGSLTVLIRGLTGYVEGVMFAILLGNTCAPLIDDVAIRLRLRRLRDER